MIARTDEEKEILREGGRRLARHLRVLSEMVVPGVTAGELEKKAHELVAADTDTLAFLGYKSGKEKHGYPSGLCLSVNDVIVHSPASENRVVIQEGDVVCLDFGIKHAGLFTDHAVTVIAGPANGGAGKKRKPGEQRHEEPRVPNLGAPKGGYKLVEGLFIAMEPMMTLGSGELYVDKDGHSYRTKDGSRTAHAEHTVLVTKNGPEILTKE